MQSWEFEKPITELEKKIAELTAFSSDKGVDLTQDISSLNEKLTRLKRQVYSNLTPWQKVQISRCPGRPTTIDYIDMLMTDFIPLHGDRLFGDDKAIISGFAKFDDYKIVIIGHQKGKDTKENIERNFGCAHPEGYRKAMRVMRLGERFNLPIVCFVDTPGAYPGVGAEERGQAQAIAENIRDMFSLKVPIVVVVIGEGGSGGALGIGVGDKVLILEYAYYSVISPEGCAAILWKDASRREEAARVLKLNAHDLKRLGVIDEIIAEPQGGAHRNPQEAASNIKAALKQSLEELSLLTADKLLAQRYQKFRKIGVFKK
ncbi:MAG: acetyl-CoA carboxylase carboxyltransferase subunit alpha [Candidatus Omnitrophota bacterium]